MSKSGWNLLAAVSLCLLAASSALAANEPSDAELLAGALQRIETHRKGSAVVRVVDASGKPVPGAKISIEQTRHAFLFGSNIFGWGRLGDEKSDDAYRARFAELLNYATIGFYWGAYEPKRGEPNHAYAEAVARWCKEHGIAVKGHPLAWNYADPSWLPTDPSEIRKLQMARIEDCVGRFAGLIDRWDVVNEATHFDRDEFMKRAPKMTGMWKTVGQMEFTLECFEHARKAHPKATLLINDYRTDPAYERVIEKLVDAQGKPLYDVIGIQSHMHGGPWTNRKIWETCERFGRFGVPLHFTEATILSGEQSWQDKKPWPSTPEGEAFQAKEVARFYTMLFSHPAVEAITWWDFCDRRAWKGAPAGFLRADTSPKPAYNELLKLIKGTWWTKEQLETDRAGEASFRGFFGQHKVTVQVPGKTEVASLAVEIVQGGPNQFLVRLP